MLVQFGPQFNQFHLTLLLSLLRGQLVEQVVESVPHLATFGQHRTKADINQPTLIELWPNVANLAKLRPQFGQNRKEARLKEHLLSNFWATSDIAKIVEGNFGEGWRRDVPCV